MHAEMRRREIDTHHVTQYAGYFAKEANHHSQLKYLTGDYQSAQGLGYNTALIDAV
jgi:hypothetical protein